MITRRDLLKMASGAALGGPALAASESDLRAKARKNIKLAIFTGVYGRLTLDEAARRIKSDGFAGVALQTAFKDAQFNTQAPDWDAAKKITDTLAAAGLKIVGLYGYYNVVDPDEKRRKVGEANMRFLIENWQRLGSPVISTETGTFNPKSPWAESPENETEKGYLACRAAFEKMVKAAEQTGAVIAIECYWRNIIGTIDRAERLLSEINSPSLKLTMDPCNYFRKEDLSRMQPMLEEIFRR
ncbi:sugar phosphate isomerase/epimerase, partial [Candidatus Sumerlaeota bacterium]|nr:sugar phosphate isomerase/epimerase [Candidatus Sumerlaeota bacterium]